MESRHVQIYHVKVDPERFSLVDNRTIVCAEMIDAIWVPSEMISNAEESITKTSTTLGVGLPTKVLGQR